MYGEMLAAPRAAGKPLRDQWAGYRGKHVGHRDDHRVVWEVLQPEPDPEGEEGDMVIPVLVHLVGPKKNAKGETIYERNDPPTGE